MSRHYQKFNINDYVRIKLTETGRRIHSDHYTACQVSPPKTEEDENGFSRWQLWRVMYIFGAQVCMGHETPFATDIEFEVPE